MAKDVRLAGSYPPFARDDATSFSLDCALWETVVAECQTVGVDKCLGQREMFHRYETISA